MSDSDRAKVLIVDDLPEKLLVYRTILEELGQELVMARSGAEALKLVLQHDFAVILLDVNMPLMDGFETAGLIRKRKRSAHTPIIFITSFADDIRTTEGYAHGAVDYIMAPVAPTVLRAKVMVFVNMDRMSRQAKRQAEQQLALVEERSRRAAAEESNRRLELLARAGGIVGSSLDFDATLHDLARLTVPALAHTAWIPFLASGSEWSLLVARQCGDETRVDLLPADAAPAAVRTVLDRVAGRESGGSCPSEGPEIVSAAESSFLVLPLVARDQALAALALERPSERTFEPADVTLVMALANRAAAALDNALLYGSVQRADRQKNEFLSMLAHELRNPLAPIRTGLETLRLCNSGDPLLMTTCEIMDRQVSHLVRLVDELLDVSRITQGKIRLQSAPVEAGLIVNNAVEMSRPAIEARDHELFVDLPPEALWLNADSVRMTQVMSNLLNNAAKYTETGGRIWVSLASGQGLAVFRVRDNGIGIPPEMLQNVFELFTQADRSLDRSEGGLGVGLTLVKHLVEMHGGAVEAQSEGAGRGSEFIVRLPLISTPGGTTPDDARSDAMLGGGRRIAVVDDNVDAADSLARLLRHEGHEVRVAYDGPTALEAVQEFRPEILFLDIGLPGLDGYEVARRLRAPTGLPNLRIVAVTGYDRRENHDHDASPFDHHLVKPVELDHVRQLLREAKSPATNAHPRRVPCH